MVSPNSICVVHKFGVSKSNGDVIIRIEIVLILYNVTKLSHTNILLVSNRFFVNWSYNSNFYDCNSIQWGENTCVQKKKPTWTNLTPHVGSHFPFFFMENLRRFERRDGNFNVALLYEMLHRIFVFIMRNFSNKEP